MAVVGATSGLGHHLLETLFGAQADSGLGLFGAGNGLGGREAGCHGSPVAPGEAGEGAFLPRKGGAAGYMGLAVRTAPPLPVSGDLLMLDLPVPCPLTSRN
jgi:hypothetical protein